MFDVGQATRRTALGVLVLVVATALLFAGVAAVIAVVFPSAPVVVRIVAGIAAVVLLVAGGAVYRRGWHILRERGRAGYWRDYAERRTRRAESSGGA
jgi:chromate transport protein ChrA